MNKLMTSLNSLLDHEKGKMRTSLAILAACIGVFLISWLIILGIGGAIGIAIGVSLALISLIFGIISGSAVCLGFIDWIDNG